MVKLSEQPVDFEQGLQCQLCPLVLHSVQQYQRHVGRHQEQLALFALPSFETEIEENNAEGSDTHNTDIADEEEYFNASVEERIPPSITDYNEPEANRDGSGDAADDRNDITDEEEYSNESEEQENPPSITDHNEPETSPDGRSGSQSMAHDEVEMPKLTEVHAYAKKKWYCVRAQCFMIQASHMLIRKQHGCGDGPLRVVDERCPVCSHAICRDCERVTV